MKSTSFNLYNKNIIITGGNGFLGNQITNALLNERANVYIIDIKKSKKKSLAKQFVSDITNENELETINHDSPDITIIGISITRFEAIQASHELLKIGIKVSVHHILWIKPFEPSNILLDSINKSKHGFLLLDDDYEDGILKNIAFDLMMKTQKKGYVMGLKNKSAGFSKETDNLPPSVEDIKNKIHQIIK
jgi:transketolase C-terminal domain/subunit